jgi:hypothetical protein
MMLTQGQSRTGGQRRQHVAGVLGLEGEQTCLDIKEKRGRERGGRKAERENDSPSENATAARRRQCTIQEPMTVWA